MLVCFVVTRNNTVWFSSTTREFADDDDDVTDTVTRSTINQIYSVVNEIAFKIVLNDMSVRCLQKITLRCEDT